MSRVTGLLLVPLVLTGRVGAAQNLGRLDRMWKEAARASAKVDSVARARGSVELDTVRGGNLIVLTPASLGMVARTVVDSTWTQLLGTYGDAIKSPGHRPLVVALYQADRGPPPYGFPVDAVPIPVASGPRDAYLVAARTALVLSNVLRKDLDKPLDRWLQGGIRTEPFTSAAPELFEDLVTSPSPLARGCLVGSFSACGAALGLVPPHDAAREWYDAAGRRDLVRHLVAHGDRGWLDQCVESGRDAACIHVLHGPDSVSVAPPLLFASRELVVRTALQLGGPQALERLLGSARQPIGRRLELASGVTLDSLLSRWRTTIVSTRPASVDLSSAVGWVSLAWAITLGLFVLGSSRWRS